MSCGITLQLEFDAIFSMCMSYVLCQQEFGSLLTSYNKQAALETQICVIT